jgi:hypothetical protein
MVSSKLFDHVRVEYNETISKISVLVIYPIDWSTRLDFLW